MVIVTKLIVYDIFFLNSKAVVLNLFCYSAVLTVLINNKIYFTHIKFSLNNIFYSLKICYHFFLSRLDPQPSHWLSHPQRSQPAS